MFNIIMQKDYNSLNLNKNMIVYGFNGYFHN